MTQFTDYDDVDATELRYTAVLAVRLGRSATVDVTVDWAAWHGHAADEGNAYLPTLPPPIGLSLVRQSTTPTV